MFVYTERLLFVPKWSGVRGGRGAVRVELERPRRTTGAGAGLRARIVLAAVALYPHNSLDRPPQLIKDCYAELLTSKCFLLHGIIFCKYLEVMSKLQTQEFVFALIILNNV